MESIIFSRPVINGPEPTRPEPQILSITPEDLARRRAGEVADQPEGICGSDQQVQIAPETTSPSWRWICHLEIKTANNERRSGTGYCAYVPGAYYQVILTCAHCVFRDGKFVAEIKVIPARNGQQAPLGSYTVTSEFFRASARYMANKDSNYDYGAILIPSYALPWGGFGHAYLSDQRLQDRLVENSGYPLDTRVPRAKPYGTQWYTGGPVTNVTPFRIEYMNDSMAGQSGSPVWTTVEEQKPISVWYVVGIHGNGDCPNSAVRITPDVWNDVVSWSKPAVLGIGTNKKLYTRATLGSAWVPAPDTGGEVTGIAIMNDGRILGIGNNGKLYVRDDITSPWVAAPDRGGEVMGITIMKDGTILGIGNDYSRLYTRADLTSEWKPTKNVGGWVSSIAVMKDGVILGVGTNKKLFIRPDLDRPWTPAPDVGGEVVAISVMPDGTILGVGNDNSRLYTRANLISPWVQTPYTGGALLGITCVP